MKIKKAFSIITLLSVALFFGCKKDDTTSIDPEITSVSPADSATKVAINSKISAVFNVEMDSTSFTANTFTFTLMQGTTPITGTVVFANKMATFTPTAILIPNTVYTATITTGVKDASGKSLVKNCLWSFTTGVIVDKIAPTVISTIPQNKAINVARNNTVAFTFSEAIDATTVTNSSFTLKQGTTDISGTIVFVGNTATFTPSVIMEAGMLYTATISSGIKDLSGNMLAANVVWSFTTGGTTASMAVVDLGKASNYVILAKTAINNISTSVVTGDLGLSPSATSYVTGFSLTDATGYATSAQITGKIFAADMADPTPINLTTAVVNMITAYNDAAGRPSPDFVELGSGSIGGKTLLPGLYKWTNTVSLSSDVTISGGANDVWIFQIAGDLSLGSTVKVILKGGAQAKNIFWQVAGQATLGTTSHIEGVILSKSGITFQTGASINGRALAQTAVILDGNTITKP